MPLHGSPKLARLKCKGLIAWLVWRRSGKSRARPSSGESSSDVKGIANDPPSHIAVVTSTWKDKTRRINFAVEAISMLWPYIHRIIRDERRDVMTEYEKRES